jgi:murein DD-endopeptidase MepM/ murein hydrolase activator NlpD
MVWWLAVPGDLRRGDKLEALFEERANEEPLVHMIRLASGKMGQTLAAYRFKPEHSPFARYFKPNGEELELRLKGGPLDDYEQVTSLINDGRHHKGVDFKTPVGTQVKATFDGTVTRKTWHFRGNGNSLEIAEDAPPYRTATFLHLSTLPRSMQVGHRVKKGEIIAASGNTGHSFAPHLHYQLMLGPKLLDPFRVHDTYRKRLNEEDKLALDAEVRRLDGLMAMTVAGK